MSVIGFTTIEIPRENLGTVLLDLKKNQALVKSAETVIIVPGKSFIPFKFSFQKIQPPGAYLTGRNDNIQGASVQSKMTTTWDKFMLVTKYLTNDSLAVNKAFVDLSNSGQ
jgi:hypothetical protein